MSDEGTENMEEFQQELHSLIEEYNIEHFLGTFDDGVYTLRESYNAPPELVGELVSYISAKIFKDGIKMTIDAEDLDTDEDEVIEKLRREGEEDD